MQLSTNNSLLVGAKVAAVLLAAAGLLWWWSQRQQTQTSPGTTSTAQQEPAPIKQPEQQPPQQQKPEQHVEPAKATAAAATASTSSNITITTLREALRSGYAGLFVETHDDIAVPIESLYTTLLVQRKVDRRNSNNTNNRKGSDNSNSSDDNNGELVRATELPARIADARRRGVFVVAVDGNAGQGKTVLLQQLAIQQQQQKEEQQHHDDDEQQQQLLIYVSLRDLVRTNTESISSVAELLEIVCDGVLSKSAQKTIVSDAVPVIWLLDGLDEVVQAPWHVEEFLRNFVDPRRRALLVEDAAAASSDGDEDEGDTTKQLVRPCDFVIVSSRPEHIVNSQLQRGGDRVEFWTLQPWTQQEVEKYCQKFFAAFPPPPSTTTATLSNSSNDSNNNDSSLPLVESATKDVVNALFTSPDMEWCRGLPMFINMCCQLRYESSHHLRSSINDSNDNNSNNKLSVTLLFELHLEQTWRRSRGRLLKHYTSKPNSTIDINSDEVFAELLNASTRSAAKHALAQFVDACRYRDQESRLTVTALGFPPDQMPPWVEAWQVAGILKIRNRGIAYFPHRSFIEFLVARRAVTHPEDAQLVRSSVAAADDKYSEATFPLSWTPDFSTVFLFIADYCRRNENNKAGKPQQQQKSSGSGSSSGLSSSSTETSATLRRILLPESKLTTTQLVEFIADRVTAKLRERQDRSCTTTMITADDLFKDELLTERIIKMSTALGDSALLPRRIADACDRLMLSDFVSDIAPAIVCCGAYSALLWLETVPDDMGQIKQYLSAALTRALDRRGESPDVERCIKRLVETHGIEPNLISAVSSGSVAGVGEALALAAAAARAASHNNQTPMSTPRASAAESFNTMTEFSSAPASARGDTVGSAAAAAFSTLSPTGGITSPADVFRLNRSETPAEAFRRNVDFAITEALQLRYFNVVATLLRFARRDAHDLAVVTFILPEQLKVWNEKTKCIDTITRADLQARLGFTPNLVAAAGNSPIVVSGYRLRVLCQLEAVRKLSVNSMEHDRFTIAAGPAGRSVISHVTVDGVLEASSLSKFDDQSMLRHETSGLAPTFDRTLTNVDIAFEHVDAEQLQCLVVHRLSPTDKEDAQTALRIIATAFPKLTSLKFRRALPSDLTLLDNAEQQQQQQQTENSSSKHDDAGLELLQAAASPRPAPLENLSLNLGGGYRVAGLFHGVVSFFASTLRRLELHEIDLKQCEVLLQVAVAVEESADDGLLAADEKALLAHAGGAFVLYVVRTLPGLRELITTTTATAAGSGPDPRVIPLVFSSKNLRWIHQKIAARQ